MLFLRLRATPYGVATKKKKGAVKSKAKASKASGASRKVAGKSASSKKSPHKKSTPKKQSTPQKQSKSAPKDRAGAKKSSNQAVRHSASSKPSSRLPLLLMLAGGLATVSALVMTRGDGEQSQAQVEDVDLTSAAPLVPEALEVRVLREYPHSTEAFTQGLLMDDGNLFESTGLHGRSSLRRVNLETGQVLQRQMLGSDVFGEGLALVGDELVMLTWHAGRAIRFDRASFEPLGEFEYEGEGWGLCFDGEQLVMSDGSDTLFFRDPETFEVLRQVEVTKLGRPQRYLNELECVDGRVYANVWQRNEILRIDPERGEVTAVIRAEGLLTDAERLRADVLNGIAHIEGTDRFLITGKEWPRVFEVEFVAR